MNKFWQDFKYLNHTIVHPFDGFYEIKWRNKGNLLLATILLLLFGITQVLCNNYNGFIVNDVLLFKTNSIVTIIMTISPLLLFVISNWSVSTLYNGKATVKDLYLLVCYAVFPVIVINLLSIPLSNIIIMEEVPLYLAFKGLGVVWFWFLMFTGLITIQEFTIQENIMTLLATIVSAIAIIFLLGLYFFLMEQVISFVTTVIKEIVTMGGVGV